LNSSRPLIVPLDEWLRGPLKEWASELLSKAALQKSGLFDERIVLAAWKTHQAGTQDLSAKLWTILIVQQWLNAQSTP